MVATGSDGGTVLVWDTSNGQLRTRSDLGAPIQFLAVSEQPLRFVAAVTEDESSRLVLGRDSASGAPLDALPIEARVEHVATTSDLRRIAVGTTKGHVIVLDASTGKRVLEDRFLPDPQVPTQESVYGLAFDASGDRLAASSPWSVVRWYDLTDGTSEDVRWASTHGSLLFSPHGKALIVADRWMGRLARVSLATKEREPFSAALAGHAHRNNISDFGFSGDGRSVLTASLDRTAHVWNVRDTSPAITFRGHQAPILRADLSADGEWAATGDVNGVVRIWPTHPRPWAEKVRPRKLSAGELKRATAQR